MIKLEQNKLGILKKPRRQGSRGRHVHVLKRINIIPIILIHNTCSGYVVLTYEGDAYESHTDIDVDSVKKNLVFTPTLIIIVHDHYNYVHDTQSEC